MAVLLLADLANLMGRNIVLDRGNERGRKLKQLLSANS